MKKMIFKKRHNITFNAHIARGLLLAAMVGVLVAFPTHAQVQAPHIIITWHAHTYAPLAFSGKRLPVLGATIDASLAIIDKGKSVSLGNYNVYWYLDDQLLHMGKGLQKATFPTSNIGAGTMDLRVQIPDYPSGILLKTIEIPVVRPDVAIKRTASNPALRNTFSLEGLPYFFNVNTLSSLRFTWRVNGQAPEAQSRPDAITVRVNADAPLGIVIGAVLGVQNIRNPLEGASRQTSITL